MSDHPRREAAERAAAELRAEIDLHGLDGYLQRLVERAPAPTPEQRRRLQTLLSQPKG